MTLNRMGFFGEMGLGAIYSWSDPHALELSLGNYSIGEKTYWQTNFAYRYAHWLVHLESFRWLPLQVGIFTVRSWDEEHYFLESPDQYPYEQYYDQTAFRWGLDLGSVLKLRHSDFSIAYYLRFLDTGLIAIYNNTEKDLQYYLSSGLALRYHF